LGSVSFSEVLDGLEVDGGAGWGLAGARMDGYEVNVAPMGVAYEGSDEVAGFSGSIRV
jgi:hypothetical protein